MVFSWLALLYLIGAVSVFFTVPYKNDVPFLDRLFVSVFWLPLVIWSAIKSIS